MQKASCTDFRGKIHTKNPLKQKKAKKRRSNSKDYI